MKVDRLSATFHGGPLSELGQIWRARLFLYFGGSASKIFRWKRSSNAHCTHSWSKVDTSTSSSGRTNAGTNAATWSLNCDEVWYNASDVTTPVKAASPTRRVLRKVRKSVLRSRIVTGRPELTDYAFRGRRLRPCPCGRISLNMTYIRW